VKRKVVLKTTATDNFLAIVLSNIISGHGRKAILIANIIFLYSGGKGFSCPFLPGVSPADGGTARSGDVLKQILRTTIRFHDIPFVNKNHA
jgi:hypothetical protein